MDPTTILILLFLVTILALVAKRIHVPYPTVMVVGGLAICFLPRLGIFPALQSVTVPPKVIFTIFLPPLLYGAAWVTSWKDFRVYFRPIASLAIALVLVTMVGIAAVAMWLVPGMTWPAAFALGAILSPPDAIAVTALTKRVSIPRETLLVLEGESLVNDATALVALNFAIAAVLEPAKFSLSTAPLIFIYVAAGGIAAGLLVGWVVSEVHKRLDDTMIATTITFLTSYTAYLLAESVHMSGVLAVVTAGLYVSWKSPMLFGPRLRLQATAVWEFVEFMLNGLVFVLMGLQLPEVLRNLPTHFSNGDIIFLVVAITVTAVVVRMLAVFAGAFAPRFMRWRAPGQITRTRDVFVIGWTGMRGVVSLAAAMALPVALEGKPETEFPNRSLIILITFGMILITLVVQSLTLPAVLKALKVEQITDDEEEEKAARVAAAHAALTYVVDITAATDAFGEIGPKLQIYYEQRIVEIEQGVKALPVTQVGVELSPFEVHKAVLNEERRILIEYRSGRRISYELFQKLMAEVDSDELRAEKQRMRKARAEHN
jgi:monovalent cation/hydrogen antiporter